MSIKKLSITEPFRNTDEYQLTNSAYLLQDCYFDESLAIHKRPGTTLFKDLGVTEGVQGLYWWQEEEALISIVGGRTFKITDRNGTTTEITNSTSLDVSKIATFAKAANSADSNKDTLFIANGPNPVYTTSGNLTQFPTGVTGTPPTKVTHVASRDGYLAVNDLDNKTLIKLSNPSTPLNFSSALDFSAQARTDDISGIYANGNSFWVQGKDSIEPFYNTGQATPWIRINGALVEPGTVNPYAVGLINGIAFYLASNRSIFRLEGSTLTQISLPYQKRIDTLVSIRDVEVDILTNIGGKIFILFNFRDAKTTLVYDYSLKLSLGKDVFYEWGLWDTADNEYKQFKYRAHAFCTSWNLHIVGDRETGKLYTISPEYFTDNGDHIRSEVITGVYGNPLIETRASNLYLDVRRGDGISGDKYTSPKFYWQFRDNKAKAWSNQIEYDLGKIGDTGLVNIQLPMAEYYTRQYRFLHMDNSPFIINGVYEETID